MIIGGASLYCLGLVLMCDRVLLLLGNFMLLGGLGHLAGGLKFITFLFNPVRLQGTLGYSAGFFLILVNWPFLGVLAQFYGFFYLFRAFFPALYTSTTYLPGIGPYLCGSGFLKSWIDRISGSSKVSTV